jgi:undecaprenyl-diphosphatase
MMAFNQTLFLSIYGWASAHAFLSGVVYFFAETFGVLVAIGLVIFLFSHNDRESGFDDVITILLSLALALLLAELIKILGLEARPYVALPDVNPLFTVGFYDSFPSAHAAFFAALATAVYFYHPRLSIFLFISAFLIGLARIAAGVHWPFDILAGYFIGGAVAAVVYHGYRIFIEWRRGRAHRLQKPGKSL